MIQVLAVLLWVVAGFLAAALIVTAARRRPQSGWAELGVVGVLLTNLGTTVPMLLDLEATPAPWLLSLAMGSWLVVLFVFPDGRPAPPWTIWVLLAGVGLLGLAPATPFADSVRAGAFVCAFSIGVGAQVWRYQRRSTVRERQATKWLLAGLVPAATAFVGIGVAVATTSIDPGVFDHSWYGVVSVVAVWLVPVTATVGLLAGGRGPIDAVVHTLIVAAGTAVGIAWVYFAIVAAAGPTWAAAIAAVLVLPFRALLARIATRIVYAGDLASPVALLGQRLESSVSAQDVSAVVARTVADTLGLPYVAVRLEGSVAAEVGDARADQSDLEAFGVQYLGAEVAELLVAPRSGDLALAARDRGELVRLAASAGPALHGAATLRALSLARERLVITREEERRRLRRDLHDDLAPTLAGLGMRVAAAASLKPIDPTRAERLQRDVQDGIQAAIAQIREIAYDLRPAVLDDHGLEMAIRDRLATDVDSALQVDVEARDLPSTLPAAVELAALRIVQEAVTNVRRHARASTCRISLRCHDHSLLVSVEDDGRGLDPGHVRRVGMHSIEERARELGGLSRVEAGVSGGTTVSVILPMRETEPW